MRYERGCNPAPHLQSDALPRERSRTLRPGGWSTRWGRCTARPRGMGWGVTGRRVLGRCSRSPRSMTYTAVHSRTDRRRRLHMQRPVAGIRHRRIQQHCSAREHIADPRHNPPESEGCTRRGHRPRRPSHRRRSRRRGGMWRRFRRSSSRSRMLPSRRSHRRRLEPAQRHPRAGQ